MAEYRFYRRYPKRAPRDRSYKIAQNRSESDSMKRSGGVGRELFHRLAKRGEPTRRKATSAALIRVNLPLVFSEILRPKLEFSADIPEGAQNLNADHITKLAARERRQRRSLPSPAA